MKEIQPDASTFYVVATPIGNLHDITLRAINILKYSDIILAEDTRVTLKLLVSLKIRRNQKLISCHNFNERSRVEKVKGLLDKGMIVSLVSDSGTPLISDPGYIIVSGLRYSGYKVTPIPGPSALVASLSASGLPSDSFIFKGFLSANRSKRIKEIQDFAMMMTTVVIYESVHRVESLLEDLKELIPFSDVVLVKELTKYYEKFISGKPGEVLSVLHSQKIKGEFVVIIDCSKLDSRESLCINESLLLETLLTEVSLTKAVKITSEVLNLKKNDLYTKALNLKKGLCDNV